MFIKGFINNLFFNHVFRIQMWLYIMNRNFKSESFDPTALIRLEGGWVDHMLSGEKRAGSRGALVGEAGGRRLRGDSQEGAQVWGFTA